MKQKEINYINHRRKTLRELMRLVYDRDCISKKIRMIQKELKAWDNVLVNDLDNDKPKEAEKR